MRPILPSLLLVALAWAVPASAQTAAPGSIGPGKQVPLTDLLGGPAIPFAAPSEAVEGRDLTLDVGPQSNRRTLPSAIAFPPRMPPRDRPGLVTVGPYMKALEEAVVPAADEEQTDVGDEAADTDETAGLSDRDDQSGAEAEASSEPGTAPDEAAADAEPETEAAEGEGLSENGDDPAQNGGAEELAPLEGEPVSAVRLAAEPGVDRAFGAYQRGFFLTSLSYALYRAEAGEPTAQTLMGVLMEDGRAIGRDYAAAADWFRLASDQGDTAASYRLALLYLAGDGVEQDKAEAAKLFRMAADAGNPDAAYNLAILTLEGSGGLERDAQAAAKLLQTSSDARNADATYALALLYDAGEGVVPDDRRATALLLEAAEGGNVPAQVEYAIRLFKGVGTLANERVAAAWFERAAHSGNPVAMNRLARLYANGRGVELDKIEAIKWHLIARSRGLSDIWLDSYMEAQPDEDRAEARRRARTWWNG
ncbi:tetratricopeptide repeat protein [Amorphus coralli]|uniref:tetratricopeptide repeat protein n=1 Tax=Amorphus coralli TaxID=340680 RepID=UPI00041C56AF|nr:tetratricopeptide repeat protein [Amorphus coralli]